ncbi:MAG TPA: ABC transporter substrate-binding protein [Kineosporiaceae bacterium]|jgi:osmoprotectant transport system substrate-binding protein|nr:ABC transporter substrate-binding protein [Kineosporiaceae bacterium]
MTATRHLSISTPPRPSRRRLGALAAIGAVGLLLAACGGSGDAFSSASSSSSTAAAGASGGGDKNITVGGANFTEMLIMQQLYGQLLAKAGYNVQYKAVTAREVYEPALEKGDIDVVPEYLATMADFMNGKYNGKSAPSISSSDAQATLGKLKPVLEKAGLTAFAVSPAADSNAFAVLKKFADTNNLKTLSDLAKLNKPVSLAATTECPVRPFCQPGLEKTYGLKIKDVVPLGFGTPQAKQAVVSGKADMVLTGTTDATLSGLGLVLLQDDKGLQNADNLVPIVNTAAANKPDIQQALDKLSQTLTTQDLSQLDAKVDAERQKPEDVAKQYLTSKGLL